MHNGSVVKVGGRGRGIYFTLDDLVPLVELEGELCRYLDGTDGFFSGARITVDVGRRIVNGAEMTRLRQLLEGDFMLEIAEVRSGAERVECGLGQLVGIPSVVLPKESAPFRERTLLVKGPRRSGSSLHHDGDLVVLGEVNPGAEVTAGGDVIVFGTLLGSAHAGFHGDDDSVVVAMALCPAQLRIGRHLAQVSNGKRRKKSGFYPEIASVRSGEITVEPFTGQFQKIMGWEAT